MMASLLNYAMNWEFQKSLVMSDLRQILIG